MDLFEAKFWSREREREREEMGYGENLLLREGVL